MPVGKLTCIPTIDETVQLCKDDEMIAIVGIGEKQEDTLLLFKEKFQDMKFGFTTDEFMKDFNKKVRDEGREDQSMVRFFTKILEKGTWKQVVDIAVKRSHLDDILSFLPAPVKTIQLDGSNFGSLELSLP